jgi:hypothetical protein
MFKRSAAQPTHGWLIGNRIIRKLAWAFIILVLLSSFWAGMVTYAIRRDCNQLYTRNLKVFGYWIHIEAGSNKFGCPQPIE